MTGLINIINQYSSKLSILPIIVVMNIIISLLIYFLTRKKFPKFIPSIIMGVLSIIIGIYSISIFTTARGLNLSWIAVFLATAAFVGLFTCFIVDLILSIKKNYDDLESNKQPVRKASKKTESNKSKNKKLNSDSKNTNKKNNLKSK
ncbi:hypothetical protein [uncultured Anaerococcus sp.]|uniref:hypothetical protein n=1 Tax=uncultured Anaerococcus sp. TaxID=293428 RepID=UPI0026359C12|nr:hypothetical protein [uncultured Anaerococcus sp.]